MNHLYLASSTLGALRLIIIIIIIVFIFGEAQAIRPAFPPNHINKFTITKRRVEAFWRI